MANVSNRCKGLHSEILRELAEADDLLGPIKTGDAELISEFNKGNLEAGHNLFRKHYKMIIKVVLDATKGRWFSDDCFQSGAIGLYEAAKRFDATMGNKFLTYAVPWIRKFVLLEVTNSVLPVCGIRFTNVFRDKLHVFIGLIIVGKSKAEIIDRMKISEKLYDQLDLAAFRASQPLVLTQNPGEDEGEVFEGYCVEPSSNHNVENDVLSDSSAKELELIIKGYAQTLDEVSCFILEEALGYRDCSPMRPHHIAKKFGIATAEVHRLKTEAFRALKAKLREIDSKTGILQGTPYTNLEDTVVQEDIEETKVKTIE